MKLWKAIVLAIITLAIGGYVGWTDGRIKGHNETMRSLVKAMEAARYVTHEKGW